MNAEIKDTIQILSASLAPITAIVALSIAYRQHRLDALKFRHLLYERRLAIFNSTASLFGIVIRDANVTIPDLMKFLQETSQAYFLFGKDIAEYLDEIYKKGVTLQSQNKMLDPNTNNLPIGEKRTRLAEQNKDLLLWFGDQFLVARDKFSEHLKLGA